MKVRFRKAITALFLLYALLLLVLPLLWAAFGETQWLLILLRYLPGIVLLTPLPLFLLLLRSKRAIIAGAGIGIIGIFYFMGLELPGRSSTGETLKVMSYNIRAGLGGPDQIAQYLMDSQMDLIALQEARAPLADPKADPVPIILERMIGYEMARGGSRGELVLLSRFPIEESQEVELGGICRVLEAQLDVNGHRLRVINLHLMTGDPTGKLKKGPQSRFRWLQITAESRQIQFDALEELLQDGETPTLLVGDFNTPPNSEGHELLSRTLSDCFGEVGAGFGYTFRADIPVWRIDYIWASEKLIPCWTDVVNSRLSDHRPLVAGIRWVVPEKGEKMVPNRSPVRGDQDQGTDSPNEKRP